jgi:hypothetical protein
VAIRFASAMGVVLREEADASAEEQPLRGRGGVRRPREGIAVREILGGQETAPGKVGALDSGDVCVLGYQQAVEAAFLCCPGELGGSDGHRARDDREADFHVRKW